MTRKVPDKSRENSIVDFQPKLQKNVLFLHSHQLALSLYKLTLLEETRL